MDGAGSEFINFCRPCFKCFTLITSSFDFIILSVHEVENKAGTYPFEKIKTVITAGNIVTIGSDSHKPEHLGAFIDEKKQELIT